MHEQTVRCGGYEIRYGFSDRNLTADEAYQKLSKSVSNSLLVRPDQTHEDRIAWIRSASDIPKDGILAATDALLTSLENCFLTIRTADCLSVFLIVPDNPPLVGLAHAGWRGTAAYISQKMVEEAQRRSRVPVGQYHVVFGPSIRPCCYEVGEEFSRTFGPGVLTQREGKYYLDLVKANAEQLEAAGIPKENMADAGICTVCQNDKYFSFRKEKDKADRLVSWIRSLKIPPRVA